MSLLSWKSVELQVALPRTQDAGKQQDLMSKQGQRFQETLSQSQLQQEIRKRKQVQKFNKTDKSKINDESERSKAELLKDHNEQEDEQEDQAKDTEHPYLGGRFDYSG